MKWASVYVRKYWSHRISSFFFLQLSLCDEEKVCDTLKVKSKSFPGSQIWMKVIVISSLLSSIMEPNIAVWPNMLNIHSSSKFIWLLRQYAIFIRKIVSIVLYLLHTQLSVEPGLLPQFFSSRSVCSVFCVFRFFLWRHVDRICSWLPKRSHWMTLAKYSFGNHHFAYYYYFLVEVLSCKGICIEILYWLS